ncbi:MAG: endolytic transglycosylase MltG [Candidatus Margulisiibacteriota bacterium]|jgi:UPF0755 protein
MKRLLIAVALITIILFPAWFLFGQKANAHLHKTVEIDIPFNASASQVIKILKEEKLVRGYLRVKIAMKLTQADKKIKAGAYYLSPDMTTWQILQSIQGKGTLSTKVLARVTIPEGYTIEETANVFDRRGLISKEEFMDAAATAKSNYGLLSKYKFLRELPIDSIEGYLFPDTYYLSAGINPTQVIDAMLDRFNNVVVPLYEKSHPKPKHSLHQVLTMASIVEQEAIMDNEREIVASVFYNRLRNRMNLASCPTVKYALGNPRKAKLYYSDLDVLSPYNTYRHMGLPPGPICNPGIKSVAASINPAKTSYYYFASRGDGTNAYSHSSGEHASFLRSIGYIFKKKSEEAATPADATATEVKSSELSAVKKSEPAKNEPAKTETTTVKIVPTW